MLGEIVEYLVLDRLFRKLSNSVQKDARKDQVTGEAILDYSAAIKSTMVVLSFLLLMVFVLLYFFPRPQSTSDLIAEALVILLFLFLGSFIIYYALVETRGCYRLSQRGIRWQRPFFKDRFIAWGEITSIDVSLLHQSVVAHSPKGKFHFSVFLNGLRDFAQALKDNLPDERRVETDDTINGLLLDNPDCTTQ